ncbi:MAG: 2-C-methyl-D-erythritol 2,4-cyclodiphosphate synthase [Deltaproteobacteria bacterium]|nr:2-C-methyl-D-erythritol 2,4-cyclodiphosphate synthase [Deltaproteobacteria bacterium]
MNLKIGLGKDSHRFVTDEELSEFQDKRLLLGQVLVEGMRCFKAHSDGDVIYHAVFNALASGLGLKSIGHYFPDTDSANKEKDSRAFLSKARELVEQHGYEINNLAIVIECKAPKIDPISDQIKENLANDLGIESSDISITATTGEGMTPWGQGLGVEVTCSVLLYQE